MLDLSRLSVEQRQAVVASNGPFLIVAGPGSGKTTVLAARIAYLVVWHQVPPTSILALTFASKAARELRARLVGLLGDQGRAVDVSTFHAFGLRVVRQWSEELGLGPGLPVVYPAHEARALLREVAEEVGIDLDRTALSTLEANLERRRLNVGVPFQESDQLGPLIEAYEDRLRRRGGVDYPAMLVHPLRLFSEWPRTLRLCQDAYRAVLVDEFQDVCAAQYTLLRQLAVRHRNLSVVGDPRQSLYGWRGAHGRFMDDLRHDFPEVRTLNLSQNFRSTRRIVDVANALGARLPYDSLWTGNPPGESVQLRATHDEQDEAAFVAGEIGCLRAAGLIDRLGEVAILFRINRQALPFTVALREHGLPYRVQGSGDLFARREVRDVVAYLRLAYNPDDALALARIVNVPPRRLGRLAGALRERPTSTQTLIDVAGAIGPGAVSGATSVLALIESLHAESARRPIADLIDLTIQQTGYVSWLEGQADGQARLAHVRAFRALAERTQDELGTWLATLQLDEEMEADRSDEDRVLLSTIHRAKGAEWRVVFVVGMEEGLLPHARAIGSRESERAGIDEELGVAYVAVTRPRERLYLTYCRVRQAGQDRNTCGPSRFLRGLPLDVTHRAA